MKILVTGSKGQLGTEIIHQIRAGACSLGNLPSELSNATVIAVDLPEYDLSKRADVDALLAETVPDVVINCAAFTNVDLCEQEQDMAFGANAITARNLAIACNAINAKLIHVSTDYVFNGKATLPINETALPAPESVYGASKLLGENYIMQFCNKWFIVRTSWLYGQYGNNFVKTIARIAREKGALQVVNDQIGTPTNAEDLAFHLLKLATSNEYGLYHCTGEGVCSWFDFAAEIIKLWNISATVTPCTTEEFPRPAKRPAYSVLDNAMLRATVGNEMRDWKLALVDFYEKTKNSI